MSQLNNLNKFVYNSNGKSMSRSTFNLSHSVKSTMTAGKLHILDCIEVLPGDTFQVDYNTLVRSITPAVPVIDNSFLDVFYFWVPNRLSCYRDPKDWAKIVGENTGGYWSQAREETLSTVSYTMALMNIGKVEPHSIANGIGLPLINDTIQSDKDISILPAYAYALIYNEWFRDQNTQAPYDLNKLQTIIGKKDSLFDVNKYHDYFTSCLPAPQKGPSVLLPILGTADIKGIEDNSLSIFDNDLMRAPSTTPNVKWDIEKNNIYSLKEDSNNGVATTTKYNFITDLSTATGSTINQLRLSFAIQKFLEKDARGGSRYIEILKNHFGITIPDATIQRPEYLGGKRIPLNVDQVLQTSGTTDASPLGTTGAFSNTFSSNNGFIKSFNEFGYLMTVACIRNAQSYSQGIPRHLLKMRRFDYYWPVFANIGEQPVKAIELHAEAIHDRVFGYNEAWVEYRSLNNRIAGYLAHGSGDDILQQWTYQNHFSEVPTLNSDFMKQPRSQIDNTLVITDSPYQFILDYYVNIKATRQLPVFSIPGLIDHH